jgi:hypothetical protein
MTSPSLPALACLLPLAGMILSDFRQRRIAVVHLLLFAVAVLASARFCFGGEILALRLTTNLLFLALLYICLWVYVCVVRKKEQAIGLGDLLFLPLLAPFFDLYDFVLFLTGSFLFSLLVYGLLFIARKQKTRSVPLVGTVGLCFLIYLFALWIR